MDGLAAQQSIQIKVNSAFIDNSCYELVIWLIARTPLYGVSKW